jgi:hypothetical protein
VLSKKSWFVTHIFFLNLYLQALGPPFGPTMALHLALVVPVEQSALVGSNGVSAVPETFTLRLTSITSKWGFTTHLRFLNLNKQALGSPFGPLILRHPLPFPLPLLQSTVVVRSGCEVEIKV